MSCSTGVTEKSAGLTEETITQAGIANPLHPNMLTAAINRLPVELLTCIILLANLSTNTLILRGAHAHPYLPYTWVCRHWRSVLIQCPVFWTLIPLRSLQKCFIIQKHSIIQKPFYREIFRRSGSSHVDVILSSNYTPFDIMIKHLFAKESNRIRRLQVSNFRRLALSGLHLPSLRGFALVDRCALPHELNGTGYRLSLLQLLPVLSASKHLDTLQCSLYKDEWTTACKDQLASIFTHIKNLRLTLEATEIIKPVLDLLHNNTRLQSLQLNLQPYTKETNLFGHFILPELQFLTFENLNLIDHFQCPKLSCLSVAQMYIPYNPDLLILKELDFSSIKYLWIRGNCQRSTYGHCILGTKERIDCEAVFSERADILFGDHPILLQEALSSIIPRLTNLIELHLLVPQAYSICRGIVPRLFSVQKIVVVSGNGLVKLLRLLNNPSRCPQLTHLSYTIVPLPENLKQYAEDVGRNLTKCLQSRQGDSESASDVALKYINLGNCPPLPDVWLEELHKLDAKIVIEQNLAPVLFSEQ
ncbi:hypothetical protein Clacol_009641 [Clathrus columnatus]|uniref:F-box domain-containing protein n=1 Tax=Clathrus columnatus TaxID=1419009 RepID=A0AAV5ARG5_9AGAM|nr:hypothetical protein Clacol_009641 [Clathrus columnatus]